MKIYQIVAVDRIVGKTPTFEKEHDHDRIDLSEVMIDRLHNLPLWG